MKSSCIVAWLAWSAVASAQPVSQVPEPQPTPTPTVPPAPAEPPVEPPPEPAVEPPPQPEVPEPAPVTPEVSEEPLTAADVRDAPRPGHEHGRTDPLDPGDSAARKIGRGMLWIPRIPLELVAQPTRGVLYLQDRYETFSKIAQLFFTEDKRIAIYPTVMFESGFGLTLGAHAFFRDLLGEGERIDVRGVFGGQYRRGVGIEIDSGHRIGRLAGVIDARWEERDRERFFGYGNTEDTVTPVMPIDPLTSDVAVETRYRLEVARISPRLRLRLPASVWVTLTGGLISKSFSTDADLDSDDFPIDEAYMTDRLPGFDDGTDFFYNELEVAWDTRRPASPYDIHGLRSTGGLAMIYGARQEGVGDEGGFFRVGLDLQRYFRLTRGPRAIELRFLSEWVSGSRSEVPFTELPRLGGPDVLRGYELDRFRDRLAAVAQVSYVWTLGQIMAGTLFVDAGRVYSGFDDLSLDDPRVGFGISVEGYQAGGLLFRAELATSIDGGIFAYVSLDPVFDQRARVERY